MSALAPEHVVIATLLLSLVLFLTDALRYDAVAILVALTLAISGVLTPEESFSGFASPAVVLVASMYAFATAVSRTGITEVIGAKLLPKAEVSEAALVFRVVLVSGLLSSVLSNAAVVATLIPVLGTVAKVARIPVSRLLMPLSFGSLLGGMLTVIGTSKNIVVNGLLEQAGAEPFGLFDFTLYGLCLLVVGALYFLGPGRRLLPKGRTELTLTEHYQVPKFVTEVLVDPSSHLINRSVADIDVFARYDISILGLVRAENEGTLLAPGPYNRIRTDDVLILQGEPESIMRMRMDLDLRPRESARVGNVSLVSGDVHLVEAIVPGNSTLVARTLKQADFLASTGLNVLAISKHGDVLPTKLGDIPLEVGDTLLVQGHKRDLARMAQSRSLILMGEHQTPDVGHKAYITVALLAAVLAVSALTSIHLSVAALAGATGLVLTRCLTAEDVRRGMDWSVLILIGGMLALGRAFAKHDLDVAVATWIEGSGNALQHPLAIAALVFVVTLGLTQVINHVAAAAIMTPVALSLAQTLGIEDSRALIMAVLTGAEFAFMSPIAHQANAMVMGPGDYRYRDFLRAGTPLTIVLGVVAIALLPVFYDL